MPYSAQTLLSGIAIPSHTLLSVSRVRLVRFNTTEVRTTDEVLLRFMLVNYDCTFIFTLFQISIGKGFQSCRYKMESIRSSSF